MRPRFASAPLRLAPPLADEDAFWDVLDRRGRRIARGISLPQVRARRAAGLMPNATLIAREDTTEWQPIDELLARNREPTWFVTRRGGKVIGPVSTELVRRGISEFMVPCDSMVCRAGTSAWVKIGSVSAFADAVGEAEFDASATTTHSAVRWSFADHHDEW